MILIVSNKSDITTDFFISKAARLGLEFFRLNTEDFPTSVDVSFHIDSANKISGYIEDCVSRIDLSAIKGVWYRRPRPAEISDRVTDKHIRDLCAQEATASLEGVIKSIKCNWVSHPDKIRAAESKVYQLSAAAALGFNLPRTLITNVRSEIIDFANTVSNDNDTVIKTISGGRIRSNEDEYLVFTNIIELKDTNIEGTRYTANYLQEFVKNKVDVRVNVFRTKVFATRIELPDTIRKNAVDWRKYQDKVEYRMFELPDPLKNKCIKLVDYLGLSFSALDFVLDENGEYYFLEMNPNGQWAWIEEETGADLSAALAEALCG